MNGIGKVICAIIFFFLLSPILLPLLAVILEVVIALVLFWCGIKLTIWFWSQLLK